MESEVLISYCTTVMNRKHHIEKTLPVNVETVIRSGTYDRSEFLILDYGSSDGLVEWFRGFKRKNLDTMRNVRMFSCTDRIQQYNSGESKNTVHVMARGVAVCGIDADTLLMPGYDDLVIQEVIDKPGQFLCPPDNDFYGKVACRRSDFKRIGGYNERMCYSVAYDDTDLVYRLTRLGLQRIDLPNPYKCRIEHSIAEKLANVAIKDLDQGCAIHSQIMSLGITWRALADIPSANTIEITHE